MIQKGTLDEVGHFVPSRDFSMVLFRGNPLRNPAGKFAVMKTDRTGYRELSIGDVSSQLIDWSWDNRYLAKGSRGHLAVISVAAGNIRDLPRPGIPHTEIPWYPRFSVDGRYIAYSTSPLSGEIVVVPVQGGEPHVVAEQSGILDWTGDGRFSQSSARVRVLKRCTSCR
jgi:hypothetical protein